MSEYLNIAPKPTIKDSVSVVLQDILLTVESATKTSPIVSDGAKALACNALINSIYKMVFAISSHNIVRLLTPSHSLVSNVLQVINFHSVDA